MHSPTLFLTSCPQLKGALGIWDPLTSSKAAARLPRPPLPPPPPVRTEFLRLVEVLDLKKLLARLCRERGGCEPPPLAFERWQMRCKLQELHGPILQPLSQRDVAAAADDDDGDADGDRGDESGPQADGGGEDEAQKKKKRKKKRHGRLAREPVLPCGTLAVESGLVADLGRVGIAEDAARDVAAQLSAESAKAAARVVSRAASEAAQEQRRRSEAAGAQSG